MVLKVYFLGVLGLVWGGSVCWIFYWGTRSAISDTSQMAKLGLFLADFPAVFLSYL